MCMLFGQVTIASKMNGIFCFPKYRITRFAAMAIAQYSKAIV